MRDILNKMAVILALVSFLAVMAAVVFLADGRQIMHGIESGVVSIFNLLVAGLEIVFGAGILLGVAYGSVKIWQATRVQVIRDGKDGRIARAAIHGGQVHQMYSAMFDVLEQGKVQNQQLEYFDKLFGMTQKMLKAGQMVDADEEEEYEAEEEEEDYIPQAPPFTQMSHLITNDQLVLCYTTEGPAFGTVKDLLSMIITGKPGRGKTTALMYYVTILLKNGAEVFVWDPHGAMNDLSVLNDRILPGMPATARVIYLDRREDIINSVPVLQTRLVDRDELYRKGHQTKHPLLLLADELPVLADYDNLITAQYKAENKKRAKSGKEEAEIPSLIELIRKFVLEARKWNCFFIGSGQTTDAEVLPTKVTENASSRIVFFSSDRRARMSGLETDAIKTLLPLIRRAGSGVMIFDCSSWDGPVIGSIPMITVENMLSYLGVNVVPQLAGGVSTFGNDEWYGNSTETDLETAPGANAKIIDDVFTSDGESSVNAVSSEKRETIKRLTEMKMSHRDIAKVVALSGRNYHVYQQVCREEGIIIGFQEGL